MTRAGKKSTWLLLLLGATLLGAQQSAPWTVGPFTRPDGVNPVIAPRVESVFKDPVSQKEVHWEALHTFNPAAVVRGGRVVVLYRAEDDTGAMAIGGHTSRLGLAESADGVHFTRLPEPVFYPADDDEQAREWPGGVEDPRLVEAEDGRYVLTYTQWNRKSYAVAIATSKDLVHWTKWGPAFAGAAGGKYDEMQYKSAGIVTRLDAEKGRLVAARIDDRYWMLWGEGAIHLATSDDLIHWTPLVDASGAPAEVLKARPGRFDSAFPEVGPPPVLTPHGLVAIYNGKNAAGKAGDRSLGAGAYAAGEALFDPYDPVRVLARSADPVLRPEAAYEKTGQYAAGTTFAEGLVYFEGQWFLYYGCADSRVGVATAPGKDVGLRERRPGE